MTNFTLVILFKIQYRISAKKQSFKLEIRNFYYSNSFEGYNFLSI